MAVSFLVQHTCVIPEAICVWLLLGATSRRNGSLALAVPPVLPAASAVPWCAVGECANMRQLAAWCKLESVSSFGVGPFKAEYLLRSGKEAVLLITSTIQVPSQTGLNKKTTTC